MSLKFEKLCSLLILEHFGPTVQKVHDELQWGPKTLHLLKLSTGLPLDLVKKALCVMIQYGFVVFESGKVSSVADYILVPDKIVLLLRYPKYIKLIAERHGEVGKVILMEILKSGIVVSSSCIINSYEKLKEGGFSGNVEKVEEIFDQLIKEEYVMEACGGADSSVPTSPTYYAVNFDRFHQDMRDEVMVGAIVRRIGEEAGVLLAVVLRLMYKRTTPWATQSNPIPLPELREGLDKFTKPPYHTLTQYLDHYLRIIEEDSSNFIRKSGEGNTSSVYVNIVTAICNLTTAAIENIVEYRFGAKAARIFRLVSSKKYIDQEQLQKTAMIPDKEAKQLTYRLLQENFLHMQELRKTNTAGPSKNFYLLRVDFNQVVQKVLELCYKSVCNTLTRAQYERNENIRLLEKHDKLNSIAECMREQGTDEDQIKELVDEWITPPERGQLESIESMMEVLRVGELCVDETLFILQLYTYYQTASLKEGTNLL